MFLAHAGNHPAAGINYDPSHFLLQQLDYCEFIQLYGDRISGFHVKDAEFRPSGSGRRVRRLSALVEASGAFSVAGRWAGGF